MASFGTGKFWLYSGCSVLSILFILDVSRPPGEYQFWGEETLIASIQKYTGRGLGLGAMEADVNCRTATALDNLAVAAGMGDTAQCQEQPFDPTQDDEAPAIRILVRHPNQPIEQVRQTFVETLGQAFILNDSDGQWVQIAIAPKPIAEEASLELEKNYYVKLVAY